MNKLKIVCIIILTLLITSSISIANSDIKKNTTYPLTINRQTVGNILITDLFNGTNSRVIEIDKGGNIVWEKAGFFYAFDAERLNNGNTLVTEREGSRVIEVDSGGNIVWEKTGLDNPWDAERLDNGNTLITETGNSDRVIEVDSGGNIVWEKTGLGFADAERLDNGNTLIADISLDRVIEVDSNGDIVWEQNGFFSIIDVERLDNGNTLITEAYNHRVIEINDEGTIVWEKIGLGFPTDAEGIVVSSDILVKEIHGGFRVYIDIENIGDETAYDVPWSIDLEGGLIFIGGNSGGTIDVLDPGEETTVRQKSLFGIGHNVEITVTAGVSSKKAIASWILGPLVLGVS